MWWLFPASEQKLRGRNSFLFILFQFLSAHFADAVRGRHREKGTAGEKDVVQSPGPASAWDAGKLIKTFTIVFDSSMISQQEKKQRLSSRSGVLRFLEAPVWAGWGASTFHMHTVQDCTHYFSLMLKTELLNLQAPAIPDNQPDGSLCPQLPFPWGSMRHSSQISSMRCLFQ